MEAILCSCLSDWLNASKAFTSLWKDLSDPLWIYARIKDSGCISGVRTVRLYGKKYSVITGINSSRMFLITSGWNGNA